HRFSQRISTTRHDHRLRLAHFAQDEHFVVAVLGYLHDITGLEPEVLAHVALVVEGVEIQRDFLITADEGSGTQIGGFFQPTGLGDEVGHRRRHIGNGKLARGGDFSHYVGPLAAIREYADVDLGLYQIVGQFAGEFV